MVKTINKPTALKILLGGILILYIYSLIGRPPHVDDAWLGDHVYWLSKTGQAKSELMRGITKQEEKIVVHHKLHTYIGAGFVNVFGFSLTTLKSISLISFLTFLLIFFRYTYRKILSPNEFFIALSLLIANALIFNLSFVFRPEIMVMTFGFVSYIFLQKSLKNKTLLYPLIVAGLFAGLAVSTHLNGLIFVGAGFLLLLWNKRFAAGLIFGFSTLPAIGIYFIDMLTPADFQLWYHQISDSPSVEAINQQSTVVHLIRRIVNEQMRFLHSPVEISFTMLFLVVFAPAFSYLKKHKNLLRYTLLLVISLMFISVNKSSKYLILYLPYLVLIISLAMGYISKQGFSPGLFSKKFNAAGYSRLVTFIMIGYFSVQTIYNANLSLDKYDEQKSRKITNRFIGNRTDTLNIIAPMTSVFNEIEHFNRIQGEICYNELKKSDTTIYKTGFLKKAEEFDIDYIILSEFFIVHFGMDQLEDQELVAANYEMVHKSTDMVILRNMK